MQSPDEWSENYHENIMSEFNSLDDLTFDHVPTMCTNSSPEAASMSTNEGSLIPKGNIGKPIRRRSRASTRAPTTLLNANASNFRALVQQFTGCHSPPLPFGAYKGPINLNFAKYKNYCSGKPRAQQQKQQEIRNLHEESDQSIFSFGSYTNINAAVTPTTSTITTTLPYSTDHIDHGLFVSTDIYPPTDYPLTFDDFEMEDTFPSEELSGSSGDYSALAGTRYDDLWGH
ncbi:hypothetical protein CDL12_10081 [Handroanthus impetiginosus]|uniref:VQ domain-containing protein n=1 Tax=Handroanthus impetiginosus TaxID=429701 RepID=A0A2G9HI78_9LAMI|nr:hypothetical protein CDL12_10081 [Handroanthus impetiginosus]